MIAEARVSLTTSDGVTLEGRVATSPTPLGGVAVCHPHPLYGGDMDNPVVVRLVEVLGELGLATLRFNFRGVGASTGVHGHGVDERQDVEAARAHVASLAGPGRPVALAGYSFGAAVVADVAAKRDDLAGVVLVAPPLARVEVERFAALDRLGERLLVVAGSHDEICPPDAVARLSELVPRAVVQAIEGANHFFFGKLYPLGEAVRAWARPLLSA